jgi:hypothetical protein
LHTTIGVKGYADPGYISDPSDAKSPKKYIFTIGPTAFSWRSTKQTLTTMSSNHSERIALYKTSRECIWLQHLIKHITNLTGMPTVLPPTVIYEDNNHVYSKSQPDLLKVTKQTILHQKFSLHMSNRGEKLTSNGMISSQDNAADLLTKALPPVVHKALTYFIGIRSLSLLKQDLQRDLP